MKYYVLLSFIWLGAFILGISYPAYIFLNHSNEESIKEILKGVTTISIIRNNTGIALSNIIGSISVGIVPTVNVVYNGFFAGSLIDVCSRIQMPTWHFAKYAILESAGIIVSAKIGVDVGLQIFQTIVSEKKFTPNARLNSIEFIISLLLIFIAALIEL